MLSRAARATRVLRAPRSLAAATRSIPNIAASAASSMSSSSTFQKDLESPTNAGYPPTQPFHHAIPVADLDASRAFYGGLLGCRAYESQDCAHSPEGNPTAHHPTAPIAPRLPGHVARPAEEGRSSKTWIDYSLFGHQMVCHFVSPTYRCVDYFNNVDADAVPVPHFGVVLSAEQFHALAARVEAAGVPFIVAPHLRFSGQPGEQWVRGLPRCTSGPPRVGGEARARLRPKCLSKTTASLLSHGDAPRSLPRPFPLSPPADDVLQGPGGQQPRVQGNVHAR